MVIKIRKRVIKKASYWLYCPQCRELQLLEDLIEKSITPVCSDLLCKCGHRFYGIQKEWTIYEESLAYMETELAKAKAKATKN